MFQLDSVFVYFLSTVMLVLVASLVSFRQRRTDTLLTRLLAAYFWACALATGITYLVLMPEVIQQVPHLFRMAQFPTLLASPLAFVYVRRKLLGTGPVASDLWLLFPLGLFIVDYVPFFLLSGSAKLEIYRSLDSDAVKLSISEGWFMPPYGHAILRYAFMLLCWILQLRVLYRVAHDVHHPYQYSHRETWQWVCLFVFSQGVIFMAPLATVFAPASTIGTGLFNLFHLLILLLQCYYLLFHPKVLYAYPVYDASVTAPEPAQHQAAVEWLPTQMGNSQAINQTIPVSAAALGPEDADADVETVALASAGFQLTEEDLAAAEAQVEEYLNRTQAFTRPRYSIRHLSIDTGVGVHRISAMVNRRHGVNFYGYINRFRLLLFEQKLRQRQHDHKTLEALAQECGFQSRTTFIRAFKHAHGITPSEFLEQLTS